MSIRHVAGRVIWVLMLAVALSGLPLAAGAAPAADAGTPGITSPASGATVSGTITITGYASDPRFLKWQLDLLPGGDAGAGTFVGLGLTPGTFSQVLNTTLYPNGAYVLRLRVVRTDTNYSEYPINLTINNSGGPAATTAVPGVPLYTAGLNSWYPLLPGQTAEWVFQYPGTDNLALFAFGSLPSNSLSISVYDDGAWKLRLSGRTDIQPVGRGTPGTFFNWTDPQYQPLIQNGQLFWEASAAPAVIFHILVTNTSQQACRYWLAEAGPGAGSLTSVEPGDVPPATVPSPAQQP